MHSAAQSVPMLEFAHTPGHVPPGMGAGRPAQLCGAVGVHVLLTLQPDDAVQVAVALPL